MSDFDCDCDCFDGDGCGGCCDDDDDCCDCCECKDGCCGCDCCDCAERNPCSCFCVWCILEDSNIGHDDHRTSRERRQDKRRDKQEKYLADKPPVMMIAQKWHRDVAPGEPYPVTSQPSPTEPTAPATDGPVTTQPDNSPTLPPPPSYDEVVRSDASHTQQEQCVVNDDQKITVII